ncbi:hypothetical protein OTSANNIE_0521 [Anaplasma phagocytophilum str. Annie]|nr:hypothetical protein APHWEB_0196 [Anaplasma phagocytophilum str. Webster]KJV83501.1 hypothetical protein APHHGE2_0548 [Anaplasma phagocytophilum str. HGE2]KJV88191.1 hypothetical protein APHNYW_0275 [Anaplasma phagocytophilum str. ApNYW]KJV99250.1 hypothetical protein OTSANNIE_0521 [Anaplasma phagocytophilum str. Annie]
MKRRGPITSCIEASRTKLKRRANLLVCNRGLCYSGRFLAKIFSGVF